MLYSSCKNGLVDSVQQKGILIDKKVRQQAPKYRPSSVSKPLIFP